MFVYRQNLLNWIGKILYHFVTVIAIIEILMKKNRLINKPDEVCKINFL